MKRLTRRNKKQRVFVRTYRGKTKKRKLFFLLVVSNRTLSDRQIERKKNSIVR